MTAIQKGHLMRAVLVLAALVALLGVPELIDIGGSGRLATTLAAPHVSWRVDLDPGTTAGTWLDVKTEFCGTSSWNPTSDVITTYFLDCIVPYRVIDSTIPGLTLFRQAHSIRLNSAGEPTTTHEAYKDANGTPYETRKGEPVVWRGPFLPRVGDFTLEINRALSIFDRKGNFVGRVMEGFRRYDR